MIHGERFQNARLWLRQRARPLLFLIVAHKVLPAGQGYSLPPSRFAYSLCLRREVPSHALVPLRPVNGCVCSQRLAPAVTRSAGITKRARSALFACTRGYRAAYHAVFFRLDALTVASGLVRLFCRF